MIVLRRRTRFSAWVRLVILVPSFLLAGLILLPVFGLGLLVWAAAGWIAWREIKFLQASAQADSPTAFPPPAS